MELEKAGERNEEELILKQRGVWLSSLLYTYSPFFVSRARLPTPSGLLS